MKKNLNNKLINIFLNILNFKIKFLNFIIYIKFYSMRHFIPNKYYIFKKIKKFFSIHNNRKQNLSNKTNYNSRITFFINIFVFIIWRTYIYYIHNLIYKTITFICIYCIN